MAFAMAAMAGIQLASSYFAAQNAKETARLNKDIQEMNAEFAELDAYDAELEGQTVKARSVADVDAILGEQQARLTAADVDVTYGSAADIQEETRFIAELNDMELEKRYQEQAMGYKAQSRQYVFGGQRALAEGARKASDIKTRGILSAVQTGISGYSRG